MKCQDCRASCHPECKEHVPLPCVPVNKTILACQRGETGTISDYAPSTAPMVPSLIVHCVNEVDLRGLNEVGIYRIPGSEKDIRGLKVQNTVTNVNKSYLPRFWSFGLWYHVVQ